MASPGALTNEQIARHLRKAFPELARHRQQAERAFEERERKLREALRKIQDEGNARANAIATQALKETPDAQ